ncbi:MAG: hypothetical protein ABEI98_07270 [Halorhabdus sp.]
MSDWSPTSIPRKWAVISGVVYVILLAYALIITQQLFLFAVFPAMFFVSVYFLWRFLVAVEAIADALQRIADYREED